jgi:hypothetical protein
MEGGSSTPALSSAIEQLGDLTTMDSSQPLPSVEGAEGEAEHEVAGTSMAFDFTQLDDDDATGTTDNSEQEEPAADSMSMSGRETSEESGSGSGQEEEPSPTPRSTVNDEAVDEDGEEYKLVSEIPPSTGRIEVLLDDRPDFDKSAFTPVARDDVYRVLAELEAGAGEQWYEILFEDDRTDQVRAWRFTDQSNKDRLSIGIRLFSMRAQAGRFFTAFSSLCKCCFGSTFLTFRLVHLTNISQGVSSSCLRW